MRVLLVEDDPTTCRLMKKLLSAERLDVTPCLDAETALREHDREPYPFIVLDLMLPGMDGLEFARRIRQGADGDRPYILVTTSHDSFDWLSKTLDSGVNDYIEKPIRSELLKVRLAVAERHVAEIARRRVLESQNAAARSYIDNIIRSIADLLIVIDPGGNIHRINDPGSEMLGFRPDELIGQPAEILLGEAFLKSELMDKLERAGAVRNVEANIRAKDGREIPVLFSGARIRGAAGESDQGIVCVAKDITERRRAERQIETLAHYDSLTGLPNRTLMRRQLQSALASAKRKKSPLALLFLDLDRFKNVNDTLGHDAGDRLLRLVAERVAHCVRFSDHVSRPDSDGEVAGISRLGGDEFTILLATIARPEDAVRVAGRILEALSKPFTLDDREVSAGASIGIAVFPSDGDDADTLLRNANAAMYHAKGRGHGSGGYRFYAKSMNDSSARRLQIEAGLRRALEREEFSLHYQPLREIRSGRLTGAEALLRWSGPDGQPVSPVEFIPVAEETGLIVPIGEWVLRTACRAHRQWQMAGLPPIRVAVNLSAHQLSEPGIVAIVAGALAENSFDPEHLELEITESALIRTDEVTLPALHQLSEMGVGLALDDFGTGYSSLTHLMRFPIDRVKIDRSFVSEITTNPDGATLTAAVISMAHSLDLRVVAEGVETHEQEGFLRDRGCDEIQGYLLSKPEPLDEFVRFLEQHTEGAAVPSS